VRYVDAASASPMPPYTNWATAALVMQDAVDSAVSGDTVLVTNGVYPVGEREAFVPNTYQEPPQRVSVGLSPVMVTNAIRFESVNGPLVTTICGPGFTNEPGVVTNGMRCVFLASNAVLSGFTLTNGTVYGAFGYLARLGGGLYCEAATVLGVARPIPPTRSRRCGCCRQNLLAPTSP